MSEEREVFAKIIAAFMCDGTDADNLVPATREGGNVSVDGVCVCVCVYIYREREKERLGIRVDG